MLEKTLLLLFYTFLPIYAQHKMPLSAPTTNNAQQPQKLVAAFCTDWKALKFDSMYVMMSEATRADMPKDKFSTMYGAKADKSGKLSSFKVKEAVPGDGGIVVKVELVFAKPNPPTAVNGVYNFHVVKDNGKWKVKAIVPPIKPPKPNGSLGSHPGE